MPSDPLVQSDFPEIQQISAKASVSNATYAALQVIPGIYAGEDELRQWCLLRKKNVVVLDATDGSMALFTVEGKKNSFKNLIKDHADIKASFEAMITKNNTLALVKSAIHWERIGYSSPNPTKKSS